MSCPKEKKVRKIIVLMILLLTLIGCWKSEKAATGTEQPRETSSLKIPEADTTEKLDFKEMKKTIDESKKMTVEVFFAISVLHKKYVSQYNNQLKDLSEQEKKVFYHQKRNEFFQYIQYTDDEYYEFMENNGEKMDRYIRAHKEIENYLISIE